jgi:hypothetical protein
MKIQSISNFYTTYTSLNPTTSNPQQNNLSFKNLNEMGRYINIGDYDKVEKFHAGWKESVIKMKELVTKHFSKNETIKIMEHGPGPGNSTEVFAQIPNSKIDAIELDSECYNLLLANMNSKKNVRCFNQNSLDYKPKEKCDAVLAMFSLTHLNGEKMKIFLDNCRKKYLKDNGVLVVGDEFLQPHNVNNPKSRIKALGNHHFNVIAKAFLDDKSKLAQLEFDALKSGWEKEGDFKVSCNEMKKRLKQAGFKTIKKYKIYPKNGDFVVIKERDSGVYVYEASLR